METDLSRFGVSIVFLDEIDSTNEEIRRRASLGITEGFTVVAASQSQGQGRSGRQFFSPKGGNLYLSTYLTPDSSEILSKITVMAAVATAKAINNIYFKGATTSDKALIKWVNDIFCRGKKIGGIIAKAENYNTDRQYVILGIGVNIYGNSDVPDEISDVYGSIFDKKTPVDENSSQILAAEILRIFYGLYKNPGSFDYMDEYRKLSCVIGKDVVYFAGNEEKKVKVINIDDDGGLTVMDEDKNERTYRDGEIRIRIK